MFFSSLGFTENCITPEERNTISFQGQVANVGPHHSMEVVIRDGEKRYYLSFKDIETKKFFHNSNYKTFEITGYHSISRRGFPEITVTDYKIID